MKMQVELTLSIRLSLKHMSEIFDWQTSVVNFNISMFIHNLILASKP